MERTQILSVFVVVALLVSPSQSEACTCGPDYPPSVLEQYASVDAAFTGIVISVGTHETFTDFFDVAFLVTGVWKGVSTQVVHVLTRKGDGSCGIAFGLFLMEEFVVYADADWIYPSGPLSTHSCTRTATIESAQEDFDVLGNPSPVPIRGATWSAIKALYY
jgi:hypothetical protein